MFKLARPLQFSSSLAPPRTATRPLPAHFFHVGDLLPVRSGFLGYFQIFDFLGGTSPQWGPGLVSVRFYDLDKFGICPPKKTSWTGGSGTFSTLSSIISHVNPDRWHPDNVARFRPLYRKLKPMTKNGSRVQYVGSERCSSSGGLYPGERPFGTVVESVSEPEYTEKVRVRFDELPAFPGCESYDSDDLEGYAVQVARTFGQDWNVFDGSARSEDLVSGAPVSYYRLGDKLAGDGAHSDKVKWSWIDGQLLSAELVRLKPDGEGGQVTVELTAEEVSSLRTSDLFDSYNGGQSSGGKPEDVKIAIDSRSGEVEYAVQSHLAWRVARGREDAEITIPILFDPRARRRILDPASDKPISKWRILFG